MERIVSKKQEEKRKKKRQFALAIVLSFILFASLFGVMTMTFGQESQGSADKVEYNGYHFFNQQGYWMANIQGTTLAFKHNPEETENITTNDINSLRNYRNKPLYVYSEDAVSNSQVIGNMHNFTLRIQEACPEILDNPMCEEDDPIKSCEENMIIVKEGENNIKQENNCLIISGSKESLIKRTDEALFHIFNIK